jgi:hypothetical protein
MTLFFGLKTQFFGNFANVGFWAKNEDFFEHFLVSSLNISGYESCLKWYKVIPNGAKRGILPSERW